MLLALTALPGGGVPNDSTSLPAKQAHGSSGGPPATAPAAPNPIPSPLSRSGLAGASSAPNTSILGHVFGIPYEGGPVTPLSGAVVDVLAIDRTTVLATTRADAVGGYTISLDRLGSFYVASEPQGSWGGGWPSGTRALSPTVFSVPRVVTEDLFAYPRISYNNATFVLPGWSNLSAYLDNGNGNTVRTFVQQPALSWVQDGVYFVNASNDLVFFSFANRSLTLVHPWVPLYTNLMGYSGWQNEFFLTQDGQYAYGAGCLVRCNTTVGITFYAVNLTTGRAFEHNFSRLTAVDSKANGQVNMVGLDGNASTAVFISSNGRLHEWNLWNDTEWFGTTLTYFEANNAYWVPYLNSYVNFEAEGAKGDHLEQWKLDNRSTWTRAFAGQWYTGGFAANGVNGLYLNLTSHLLWTGVDYHGGIQTFAYRWSENGTLGAEVYFYQTPGNVSTYPNPRIVPQITSDEHRSTLVSNGPAFQTAWWPYGGNDSFVVDPTPGHMVFFSSNVSVDHLDNATYYPTQAYAHSYSLDGQYFDTSRMVSYYSYDCLDNFTTRTRCPVEGTSPGTTPGTIYYVWRSDSTLAANPPTNGHAEAAPAPNPILTASHGTGWVNVSWVEPESPIVGYSLSWGSSPFDWSAPVGLDAQNSSYNISGLQPGTTYSFRLVAWNLHFPDSGSTFDVALPSTPGAVTDLRVVAVNATNVTVAWTNPPGLVLNDTVFVGATCGPWDRQESVGASNEYRIEGLAPSTRFCIAVASWNATEESPLSGGVWTRTTHVPPAPVGLLAAPVGPTSIALSWTNPPGTLTNVTLAFGRSCGAWNESRSLGVVGQAVLTGLARDTVLCFAVAAWNASGESPLSFPVEASPLPTPPDPPVDLSVTALNSTSATLQWELPADAAGMGLENVTVYEGEQCGAWSDRTSLGGVTDGWTRSGLSPGSNYSWSVSVWNQWGESPLSGCTSAATVRELPPHVRGSVSNVTVVALSPTAVTLAWRYDVPPGATSAANASYFVVGAAASCGSTEETERVPGSPANVTGLLPHTPYCFSVAAVFQDGTLVTGPPVVAQTPDSTRPASPSTPSPISEVAVGGLLAAGVLVGVVLVLGRRRARNVSEPLRSDSAPFEAPVPGVEGSAYEPSSLSRPATLGPGAAERSAKTPKSPGE